jgi:hypothetical protein
MGKIPLNTVRRILKEHIKGDVTQEGVIYVRDFLQDMLIQLADNCAVEQERTNLLREQLGIRKCKRIDKSVFINLSTQLFNQPPVELIDETGQRNIDTVFSKANVEVV